MAKNKKFVTEEQKKLLKNYKEVGFEELKAVVADACKRQLEGTPAKPILVWGAPGTGKSAAMDAVVAHDDVEKECGIRRFREQLNYSRCSFDVNYAIDCCNMEESSVVGKYRILDVNLSSIDTPSVFQKALDFAKSRTSDGKVLSKDWLVVFTAWLPLYTIPSENETISQYHKVLEGFEQYVYVPDYGDWKNFMLSQNFDRTLLDIMFRFIEQEDVYGANSNWISYDEWPYVIDENTGKELANVTPSKISPKLWTDFIHDVKVKMKIRELSSVNEYIKGKGIESGAFDLHGVRETFISFARTIVDEYDN